MKVIYPVLFYEEKENGYSVFIPDLDNESTCRGYIARDNGNGRRTNCNCSMRKFK